MKCIDEWFEAQLERTPDAVAVVFEDAHLTYRELGRRADMLAQQLRALGVGPDVLVALFLERSLDMVVGLLGVLKAGGAYVPLDPVHPRKRLVHMLADAQPLILLTQERLRAELPLHESHVVLIDAAAPPQPERLAHAPATHRARSSSDLAYVIYTSGSTGEPKGVEIEHCAVVNMLASMQKRPGLGAEDVMLAITTLVFDIAALELFLPLVSGARVVIADSETIRDGAALGALLEKSQASVMQATPATLRMLMDAGWAGTRPLKILCGGEAWTTELSGQLLGHCDSLWNMYGPTETTVWSAVDKVEAGRPIVVGRPIANTRFYVLDSTSQLVPVGVPGELYIGGGSLARGYRNRPQLTRERFLVDPFAKEPGERMYRTGDRVRRLPDGRLEFLGRLDHQVKIRGFRIELGEIESRMMSFPGLREAVVLAREDQPGEKRLVAYFVGVEDISAASLRGHLATALPEYMVPAAYVQLQALPLTPNGKVDRKALPAPDMSAQNSDVATQEPRTPTEKILARIWCDMLGLQQVGIRNNFFDVGGHSLLAVRVIGEINKTLKIRLTVSAFFQDPTIEALATILEQKHRVKPESQLLQLQPGRRGLPLYFIGSGPHEHRLAQAIGADRAVFAIDAPIPVEWHRTMATADAVAPPTIEALSALYSDVLCSHAGSSPCVIVGYSFAGKMAFESARALQRAGGNVAFVVLVDANAFAWKGPTRGPAKESLSWIWQNATAAKNVRLIDRVGALFSESARFLQWSLARLPQMVKNRLYNFKNPPSAETDLTGYLDKDGLPISETVMSQLRYLAGDSWNPSPLDASGVLIRVKFPGEEMLPGYDFTLGWGKLFARGLETTQAPGDHLSMMDDRNVAAVAQQINELLNQHEMLHRAAGASQSMPSVQTFRVDAAPANAAE